jgi:hypothetical protein
MILFLKNGHIMRKSRMRSQKETVSLIKKAISNGQWRDSFPIPKIRNLCTEWNLSATTLVHALQDAAKLGLIYKKGKFWTVGKQENEAGVFIAKGTIPSTILIVSHRLNEWAEFHGNLLAGFVINFGLEASRHQIRLYPVLTGEDQKDTTFPCGQEAIRKFRERLGSSYLGSIFTPLAATTLNVNSTLRFLLHLGGPVVWMQDEFPQKKRNLPKGILRISFGDWGNKPGNNSIQLALDELYRKGHREIAIITNEIESHNWLAHRVKSMQEQSSFYPGMHLFSILESRHTSDIALMRKVLLTNVTAVIIPNDDMAIRYYQAWSSLGKRIPEDLSMISFDNRYTLKPFPISSIDFGLDLLGYQAFHYIFGVIPIHCGRRSQIFGTNTLSDNGSILTMQ